jgi:hypothetical protein
MSATLKLFAEKNLMTPPLVTGQTALAPKSNLKEPEKSLEAFEIFLKES